MNYQAKLFIILLCTGLCAVQSNAQFRKYSNEFLNIGAGARGLGMGGAQVASTEDGNAGYWNPAGLVYVYEHPAISAMHAEYFAGIGKYDYLNGAFPLNDRYKTLGLSFLRFGVDDIPNTLYLVEPDGSINYNNISSFSSADYAFIVSYSNLFVDDDDRQLSWGANTKIIHRKVGSFAQAWGFGFDLGFMYKTPTWRLGISARDITTTFNAWSFSFDEREKEVLYLTNNDIPVKSTELTAPTLVLGGAYNFRLGDNFHLLTEANLNMTFDGKRNTLLSANPISIDPKFGIEANINDVLFLRAGASNFQQALADGDTLNQKKVWIFQPSIGAGFKIGNVAIDYAFSNLANQSNPLYSHIFSLRFDIMPKKQTSERNGTGVPDLPRPEKQKKQKVYYPG